MDHDITRRDVMKGGAATAAALAAASVPLRPGLAQGASVTGVVFEDRSGTGRRQPGDPGIAGVLVSNGREVAKTDANGRYTLPIEEESVVFVIKPTGYMVPVEPGTMLPRFYYIHQPKGTPAELNLRYRGIDPTGPLPASVDFALRKAAEPTAFEVLLFTDPQPESPTELDFVRDDVVNAVIGAKAAFGITAGDVMFDDLSLYARQNRIIGQIGLPWWNIPGNHDLNFEAPGMRYSRETFKRVFGPTSYAFEYGGALFLMLDNVEYLGTDPTHPRRDGKYQGRIGERQRAFIAAVLAETPADRLVVVAMHIPLRTYLGPKDPVISTIDLPEFLALIDERPCVSFSGHTHTTEHHYFGAADGYAGATPHHHHVMTAVSGSWWSGPFDHRGIAAADSRDGSPNGFHVLSIDGKSYTTRFHPANEPNGRQMRITLDSEFHRAGRELYRDVRMGALLGSPIPRENAYATDVIVNVFDGGPRTKVAYRIGNRAPVTMTPERRPDPFVEEVFARNEATKKPWVKADPSSHIWVARLPADLDAGTHCIAVDVTDEYGRAHRDHLVLEVTAAEATPNVRG
ncbi:MAG TPA: calcineurin-like phosphoesterase family protein [Xanthobacteraceae bacterium]|nr:calcineurin-like phosphoesterase family protein [Xanthobacteraceae bacterium]